MAILGGLLAAIGAIAVILWRLQQAAHATRDIADAAGDVRGLVRGWRWRRKANVHPMELIDDPREAAAVLMVVVAQADGAITERERTAIAGEMTRHFGATAAQVEELLARARWAAKETADPGDAMRRLVRVCREKLGPSERADLVAMLDMVAAADGRTDEIVASDIRRFAQSLRS
jgi:uncharacterized tellurite resistance protein B-like protein